MNEHLERIETIGLDKSTTTSLVQIIHQRNNTSDNELFWNTFFERLLELMLSSILNNDVFLSTH